MLIEQCLREHLQAHSYRLGNGDTFDGSADHVSWAISHQKLRPCYPSSFISPLYSPSPGYTRSFIPSITTTVLAMVAICFAFLIVISFITTISPSFPQKPLTAGCYSGAQKILSLLFPPTRTHDLRDTFPMEPPRWSLHTEGSRIILDDSEILLEVYKTFEILDVKCSHTIPTSILHRDRSKFSLPWSHPGRNPRIHWGISSPGLVSSSASANCPPPSDARISMMALQLLFAPFKNLWRLYVGVDESDHFVTQMAE